MGPRERGLDHHPGKTPPDDSLFVIAFGVVTAKGTAPITLGLQLQRSGGGAAAKIAPALVAEIARYLRHVPTRERELDSRGSRTG